MNCSVPDCGQQASYRTLGDDLVGFFCTKHMEIAIDGGWKAEDLLSLPERSVVA